MKYPKEQFELFVDGLKTLIKHYGADEQSVNDSVYNLHFLVYCNYSYNDDNANVIKVDGKRLLPQIDFELYPNGTNDDNILTATKKAIKEIYETK